jgi:hypothetical protein
MEIHRSNDFANTDGHLATARTLARLLDDLVSVPGTRLRFGVDPLLSLVPFLGDAVGTALSGYLVVIAARYGAPASVIARMVLNALIDLVFGIVPAIGDVFDFGWKANRRNLALLESYLTSPDRTSSASRWLVGVALLVLGSVCVLTVVCAALVLRWLGGVVAAL